jgi:hypothetical protein
MKKLLFLIILLVAGGYAYWPYSATSNVRDAINSSDEAGLDKVADWGSVRASVSNQMRPLTEEAMRKRFPTNLPQVLKVISIEDALNKVLEQEVNAKGLIRNTKGKLEYSDAKQLGIETRSWDGYSGFDLKFSGSDTSYHFDLKGTDGWKLVSAKLGTKDGEAYVAKFNEAVSERIKQLQAAAGKPNAPAAAMVPGITEPPKPKSWLKDYVSPLDKKPSGSGRR